MPPDHLVDHDKFNVYSKMLDLLRRIGVFERCRLMAKGKCK